MTDPQPPSPARAPIIRNRATAQRERRQDAGAFAELFVVLHVRHLHRERLEAAPEAEREIIRAELRALDAALDEAYAALLARLDIR